MFFYFPDTHQEQLNNIALVPLLCRHPLALLKNQTLSRQWGQVEFHRVKGCQDCVSPCLAVSSEHVVQHRVNVLLQFWTPVVL